MKQLTTSRVFVLVNLNPPDKAFADPVLATTGISILSDALKVTSVSVAGVIALRSMPALFQAGRMPGEVVKVKVPVAGTVARAVSALKESTA